MHIFFLKKTSLLIFLVLIFSSGCQEENNQATVGIEPTDPMAPENLPVKKVAAAGFFADLNTDHALYKLEFFPSEERNEPETLELTVIYEDKGSMRKKTLPRDGSVVFSPGKFPAIYFALLNIDHAPAGLPLGKVILSNLDNGELKTSYLESRSVAANTVVVTEEETTCDDPLAVNPEGNAYQYNGFYIGANGCIYDPDVVTINEVPPYGHGTDAGLSKTEILWYVNGANWNVSKARFQLPRLAKAQQVPVVGIFNATNEDQVNTETLPIDANHPTVVRLTNALLDSIFDVDSVRLQGGSEGPRFIASALDVLRDKLQRKHGLQGESLTTVLRKIKVETMGGGHLIYPDGPRYVHYANLLDPVAWFAGALALEKNQLGVGSVVAVFLKTQPQILPEELSALMSLLLSVHGMDVYNSAIQPFDSVYSVSKGGQKPVFLLVSNFL